MTKTSEVRSLYVIEHRVTGEVLFSLECRSLKLCVEAAVENGADLRGANLRNVCLSDAYLGNADLCDADLRNANFRGADLRGADLRGADLCDAYLRNAFLSDADLRDADLRNANLRNANLRNANFRGADLCGAYVIDAGQDFRGHRFWCWRQKDGKVVYRAGRHEWDSYTDAKAHYLHKYESDGVPAECLARLELLHGEAKRRRWQGKGE